jgi:hypothetical protein
VIPNTITASLELGRTVLEARARRTDPIQAIAAQLGGRLLHGGEITTMTEEESMGFYFTTAEIQGTGGFAGQRADLVIKNETMMLSIEGEPKVYFPDLVLLLEPNTGRGIMSIELKVGSHVSLVGVPCHPRLREAAQSPEGRLAFSPARYGRAQEQYRPIESLVPALGSG